MAEREGLLNRIEPWSPRLFLVAGLLGLAYGALWGLVAFTGVEYPILRDVVFRLSGYVIAFVALLGLYPSLAPHSPNLARAGAVFAVLALVGWVVDGLLGSTRSLAVYLGTDPPGWVAAFGVLILLGFVVAFPAFGVASLQTRIHSRAVGFALLTPLLVTVINLGIVAAGLTSPEGRFAVSVLYALTHLAIGVSLRTEGHPDEQAETKPTGV